jgi:hypothetical protein
VVENQRKFFRTMRAFSAENDGCAKNAAGRSKTHVTWEMSHAENSLEASTDSHNQKENPTLRVFPN